MKHYEKVVSERGIEVALESLIATEIRESVYPMKQDEEVAENVE